MTKNKNLIYIAGPTGVGKTDLSLEIAKKFNTDIVSCDSRQFYKELKIGASPPSYSQLKEVKHHFIHHKSIHDVYNVGKYEKDAITVINDLFKEKDNLILVGGSGLYADSIMYGIDNLPDIPPNIREGLINEYNSSGLEVIQNKLKKLDIKYYNEVDLNNSNRIIRALEIIEFTGKPFSLFRTKKIKERVFHSHVMIIKSDRDKLYKRINDRVEIMIKEGLEEEAFKF